VRSALLAVVAAGLLAAVVALSVGEAAGIETRYRSQVAQGRFVLVARSPGRDGLDAARCEALRDLPGVRSAGAVLQQTAAYPLAAPLRRFDLLTVTPGLVPVWFPDASPYSGPGLAAGDGVAAELGLVDGAVLQTNVAGARSQSDASDAGVRRSRVATVLPAAVRSPEAGQMLFEVAVPAGRTSACFVEPRPASRAAVESALGGWFGVDELATVSPFLDEQLTGRQPEAELANRVSRWVWLAGVSAAVGLVAVLWYGRREEFALYRLLGLRRGALGVLLATEAALTVAVPALIGGSVALVVCLSSLETASRSDGGVPALAPLVGADVASFVLGMVLIPVIGLGVVSWRSTFDALKGF
jgi:hypothetical protein